MITPDTGGQWLGVLAGVAALGALAVGVASAYPVVHTSPVPAPPAAVAAHTANASPGTAPGSTLQGLLLPYGPSSGEPGTDIMGVGSDTELTKDQTVQVLLRGSGSQETAKDTVNSFGWQAAALRTYRDTTLYTETEMLLVRGSDSPLSSFSRYVRDWIKAQGAALDAGDTKHPDAWCGQQPYTDDHTVRITQIMCGEVVDHVFVMMTAETANTDPGKAEAAATALFRSQLAAIDAAGGK